ncbi:GNAT family N-acetyltransferase [Irregularibacter muris]|uniref:GNAT family N-acetyltransferase n=1 Tax=Irregularibacter muris TaxID=1796619 RepID=A0AAE3KYT8_9FIRM|nr:GNAT family N-acetyltransferase [Irregularibacter muris]MCR1897541.1 GNAT family N-acetyltransferase [Irregularibacter muris]
MTEQEFAQFWEIYDNSFPKTEKRSLKEQKKLLKNHDYKVILHREQGKIIGFITLWKLKTFYFIEHFAIGKEHRNRGIGKEIIKNVKEKSQYPLILEVELPEDSIAKRRIGFYKRCGFCYNDHPYIQPSYQKGVKPIELSIMSYPHAISKNTFEHVRDKLYSQVYQIENHQVGNL